MILEYFYFSATPPSPSRPSALEVKQDSIAIKWDEAQCTGGHIIQSFTIRYLETESNPFFPFFGSFRYIRDIDAAQRNYTITGLDPETSFTIGVQATSVDGRVSSYSASAEIVTLPPGMKALPLPTPSTSRIQRCIRIIFLILHSNDDANRKEVDFRLL